MTDPIERRRDRAHEYLNRCYAPRPSRNWLSAMDALQEVALYASASDLTTKEIRAALTLADAAREEIDMLELRLINLARQGRLTWSQIAQALGLDSRQAAEQRHSRLLDRFPQLITEADAPSPQSKADRNS